MWAFAKVIWVQVVVWASPQGVFGRDQRLDPLLGGRALLRIFVPVNEAAEDQLDQSWMQLVEVWGTFGRSDPWVGKSWIRENALRNACFDGRRVAAAQPLGAEGVAALHKELEDEDAKGKYIVLWLANDASNGMSVQLGRGILQLANWARVAQDLIAAHLLYLKRIHVDHADQGWGFDQHIAFVEVADYVATHMKGGERGSQIAGSAMQVAPIETR
jgi:hypothetical protein